MKKYILSLLFMLFLLTSCVTGPTTSYVLHIRPYVGEDLEIKFHGIKYIPNGHGGTFVSELSLEEIKNKILAKNECNASIYQDTLIIEKNINGTTQIGVVSKLENLYIFEEPHIYFFKSEVEAPYFFAPTYFLNVERYNHSFYLEENEWYEISCTEAEYINVYEKTNLFKLQKSAYYTLEILPSIRNYFKIPTKIYLEFKLENNINYIRYSFK